MKHVVLIVRILFGLVFLLIGLNHFFQFRDLGGPEEEAAQQLFGAFASTGYMLELIKGTELVAGALLVAGLFVPLALILLAPVLVNIALFHAFLSQSGLPVAAVLVAIELFLAWQYRQSYMALFNPFARSSAARLAPKK